MQKQLQQDFLTVYGVLPDKQFFAPGRINLIGEHTDYNGGFVFPCAITLGTYAAIRVRDDRRIRVYSKNFDTDGIREIDLEHLVYAEEGSWTNYVKGVLLYLSERGLNIDKGFDALFFGNIPNGAGLSSSASFELLIGSMLKHVYHFDIDMLELVKIGKQVENQFIGVNSGIMDQFAIGMSRENHAIKLNTQTLDYELVPIDLGEYVIVIMNTNKRRELADSKYNERFAETREALKQLQQVVNIDSLGDLSTAEFETLQHHLNSEVLVRRAKHAVSENERTKKATEYLKQGKLVEFGQLMKESHLSTERDYEVTGIELDTLVHTAWEHEGVIGARMTGAGFGGCAIAIVHKNHVETFKDVVGSRYQEVIGYAPSFYTAQTSDGAGYL